MRGRILAGGSYGKRDYLYYGNRGPGNIKIGKTRSNQFENRMNCLGKNRYSNISGLKRKFAIEVDEYDDYERLIHEIFPVMPFAI